tara:strand:- start:3159 stop:3413 length:255 start_codon:yes stop_codon:yes gene_type:complete
MSIPFQFIFEMPPKVLLFFFVSTLTSVLLIFAEAIVSYNIGAHGHLAITFPPFNKLKLIALNVAIFYAIGSVVGMLTQKLTYLD